MIRFIYKLIFMLVKFPLRFVEFFNARIYMWVYYRLLKSLGVKFSGYPRYISSLAVFDDFNKVVFGHDVVVSKNVTFLTHDYSVTTALKAIGEAPSTDVAFIKPIVIGSNVFIGMGVFLTPGVIIGSNVVIGAGAVLRGSIPSNSVVIGNPAQVIADLDKIAHKWKLKVASSEMKIDNR